MEVFEVISKRHSYRGPFSEEKIPRKDLRRIVEAGLHAPSGKNAQTTTFVIVDEEIPVREIALLHPENQAMREARAFIACVIDRQPLPIYHGYSFQIEDCAAAVENMLLAITALGYASVWTDGWLRIEGHADRIGAILKIPEEKVIRVLLPLGVPREVRQQKEKEDFTERAWFNRHGNRRTASGNP